MAKLTLYKDTCADFTVVSNLFIDKYMKDGNVDYSEKTNEFAKIHTIPIYSILLCDANDGSINVKTTRTVIESTVVIRFKSIRLL